MSRRSEFLRTTVEEFLKVHREWSDDKTRPYPDESYWDAVDSVVSAFERGDIPDDCRDLTEAAKELTRERDAFDDRDNLSEMYPHDGFWLARKRLEEEIIATDVREAPPKPMDLIATLRAQCPGITDSQIALIYNFRDRYGNLMTQLVHREETKPGSITETPGAVDGKDWVHPTIYSRARKAAKEIRPETTEEVKRARARKARPVATETPQDLWDQQLTAKQAAKALNKPLEEVEQLFAEFAAKQNEQIQDGTVKTSKEQAIKERMLKVQDVSAVAREMNISPGEVIAASR